MLISHPIKKIVFLLLLIFLCYGVSRVIVTGNEMEMAIVLIAFPVLALMYRKPEFIVLGIFIYLNTLFRREAFPVRLDSRLILPSEILVGFACWIALKDKQKAATDQIKNNPVMKWLVFFLIGVLISTVSVVILMGGQLFGSGYSEIHFVRRVALYLLAILAPFLIKTKKQLGTLLIGFMMIATIMSILFTLSFFTGKEGIVVRTFPIFMELERTHVYSGVYIQEVEFTRYSLTALVLTYAAFSMSLSLYLHTRSWKWIVLLVIFFLPILLKFNRMSWISFMMVLPIYHFAMARQKVDSFNVGTFRPQKWARPFTLVLILGGAVLAVAYWVDIPFLKILGERITGIFRGLSTDPSYLSRLRQIKSLMNGIHSNPLMLVLGGGSKYLVGDSTYVAFLGRMGLPGIALFLMLSYQYIRRSFHLYYSQTNSIGKALILGSVISYIQLLINGVSATYFSDYRSVATIALLLVLPDLVDRLNPDVG